MTYATLDDLRSQLGKGPGPSDAYTQKMLHPIPDAPVVDRVTLILDRCQGKRVLDFGATGSLSLKIREVCAAYHGVDREAASDVVPFDLDDVHEPALPRFDVDIIICGELLEHLSNPGWFLARLCEQYGHIATIITVPNAFAKQGHLRDGIENVNIDHVCWYSFRTLKTLLARAGYTGYWFGWYHGQPLTAEGLIVVLE